LKPPNRITDTDDYLRRAEEAERAAARTYNAVEYGEHLEAAKVWRELAKRAATQANSKD
jgi:hypothetical protein